MKRELPRCKDQARVPRRGATRLCVYNARQGQQPTAVSKVAPAKRRGVTGAHVSSVTASPHILTLQQQQQPQQPADVLDLFHEPGLLGPACQLPGRACGLSDPVCQLDVRSDPVDTLQQLRHCLAMRNSATLIVLDGRPNLLLDAVSLLHLLNQDLRLEEDYNSMVLFQPILRAEALYIDGSGSVKDASASTSSSMDGQNSNSIYSRLIGSSMALHVTKLCAPGLLQQLPTSVVAYTPPVDRSGVACDSRLTLAPISKSSTTSEVWSITEQIVERLETHVMTQLRCVGPRSLVVAFRAIKRARKLLHLAGKWDLLVSPHIITDKSMVCFNCWRSKSGGLDTVALHRET